MAPRVVRHQVAAFCRHIFSFSGPSHPWRVRRHMAEDHVTQLPASPLGFQQVTHRPVVLSRVDPAIIWKKRSLGELSVSQVNSTWHLKLSPKQVLGWGHGPRHCSYPLPLMASEALTGLTGKVANEGNKGAAAPGVFLGAGD